VSIQPKRLFAGQLSGPIITVADQLTAVRIASTVPAELVASLIAKAEAAGNTSGSAKATYPVYASAAPTDYSEFQLGVVRYPFGPELRQVSEAQVQLNYDRITQSPLALSISEASGRVALDAKFVDGAPVAVTASAKSVKHEDDPAAHRTTSLTTSGATTTLVEDSYEVKGIER